LEITGAVVNSWICPHSDVAFLIEQLTQAANQAISHLNDGDLGEKLSFLSHFADKAACAVHRAAWRAGRVRGKAYSGPVRRGGRRHLVRRTATKARSEEPDRAGQGGREEEEERAEE